MDTFLHNEVLKGDQRHSDLSLYDLPRYICINFIYFIILCSIRLYMVVSPPPENKCYDLKIQMIQCNPKYDVELYNS